MIKRGEFGKRTLIVRKTDKGIVFEGDQSAFMGYRLGDQNSFHGVFAEWKVENNCLKFVNDEFGFFPVYFYQDDEIFAISNSPLDLLEYAKVKELDETSMAVFFHMQMFIGDMTPFRGIKALPPGLTITYDENGLSMVQDHIAQEGSRSDISVEDARMKFAELFQKAVEKYRDAGLKKIGVPLSGGRDSRHILFALDRAGMEVHSALTTFAQAPKPDQDALVAQEVTKAVGTNHVLFHQPAISLEQEFEKNEVANFIALHHSWIVPLARHLEDNGFDAIFDGLCGGTLSAGEFLTEERHNLYQQGRYEQIADEVVGDSSYLEKMLGQNVLNVYSRDLAVKAIAKELEAHKDKANPISQFSLWNLSRRSGGASSWMILHRQTHVFTPFLDPEVYEFLTSLPPEYFFDHTFHTKALQEFYPEYADLPFENKGATRKRVKNSEAISQSFKLLCYYLKNLGNGSRVSTWYSISRALKGLLIPSYYNSENSQHYIPIYMNHIEKYLK